MAAAVRSGIAIIRPWLTSLLEGAAEAGQAINTYENVKELIRDNIRNAPPEVREAFRGGDQTQISNANMVTFQDFLGRQDPGTVHGKRAINDVIGPINTQPSYSNNHRRPQPQQINREGPANNFRGEHINFEDVDMTDGINDTEMEEAAPMVARAPGGGITGAANSVSKETPVLIPPTITYGLQETHTTILPYRSYCTMVTNANSYDGTDLRLRMNGIYDVIAQSLSNPGTDITTSGVYASVGLISSSITTSYPGGSFFSYPSSVPAGANVNEGPWWRNYWDNLYEYYTVLGCKWKITFQNPIISHGASNVVAHFYESYSDTKDGVPSGATLSEMQAFKNINWARVDTSNTNQPINNGCTIISGTYKPGMIRHNVKNDGDVKTWTPTAGAAVPTLLDCLRLTLFQDPLTRSNSANNLHVLNCLS